MNETKVSVKNPFHAKILKVTPLNKEGSSKANHFVELSIEGSGIKYQVGCSFGLFPSNSDKCIADMLNILKADPETKVTPKKVGHKLTLAEFLTRHVNMKRVTKKIAQALIPFQHDNKLATLLETNWKQYSEDHDLVQFLKGFYDERINLHDLIDLFGPMLPRFFSVCSSQNVMKDTVQLFIADFSYTQGNKAHRSLTTNHLLSQKTIPLFHQQNPSFYPPEVNSPVIMIGPGTGIAAFLGFIQERIIHRKCSNNVLFMGDRNKETDFYFKETLKQHENEGNLKLFCAFSRDQEEKVYVQDRIWEQREMIFDMIENQNGQVFISGDAGSMAKGVVATFEKIYQEVKGLSHEEAHAEINALRKNKRFHLDVY